LKKFYQNNTWVNQIRLSYVYSSTNRVVTGEYWYTNTSSWGNTSKVVDEYELTPVGVSEFKKPEFYLYPTLVTSYLNIAGLQNSNNISIYDVQAKLIERRDLKGSSIKVDVSSLPPGLYFITSDTGVSRKFFKE